MKDVIKFVIALIFITGAYFLGFHMEDEKHTLQMEKLKSQLSSDSMRVTKLLESIHRLQSDINKIKSQHATNRLKDSTKPLQYPKSK